MKIKKREVCFQIASYERGLIQALTSYPAYAIARYNTFTSCRCLKIQIVETRIFNILLGEEFIDRIFER